MTGAQLAGITCRGTSYTKARYVWASNHPHSSLGGWLIRAGFVFALVEGVTKNLNRQASCEQRGYHNPYRPVDHLAEYKCWDCGAELVELRGLREARVRELLDDAMAEVEQAAQGDEASLARYSNRR